MSLSINTNAISLNSQRNTVNNMASLQTTMARLSSGLRINSAKDDAAGLAIAERLNSQARGQTVALQNAGDGLSMVEVADGALSTVSDTIQRIRDLAIRAKNGTNDDQSRLNLNQEFNELKAELLRIANQTSFNNKNILGTSGTSFTFQIGANAGQSIKISLFKLSTTSGVGSLTAAATKLSTAAGANSVIGIADSVLQKIVAKRAKLGAYMARFENVMTNLRVGIEKQTAARGRIMDADFAAETANLSRTQILQQAGTAMIAQANQLPQNVLALLR